MSLIDPPVPPITPPDEVTKNYMYSRALSTQLYDYMLDRHTKLFNYIWFNPNGVTVEQMLAKYGTDGRALFEVSGMIQNSLLITNPEYEPLVPPKKYTIFEDGHVEIVEPS